MLKHLLSHEIQSLLKSNRVYWTVCLFLLLFASVFIVRVVDYQDQINQYIADVKMTDEALQTAPNYSYINPRAIVQPIIFSIYNDGYKISRVVDIIFYEPITHSTSLNEETNLLDIEETSLDITFLITFFLPLFILLISYDSVNGEKRVGTLRLMMTYPLKRQSFILKKILGIFIFVGVTFTIPYLLSLISLVVIYANLLTANFFLSAILYWFLVLLFIFFFSLLGIFISTCTTNPNRSLVYSLLVWILFSIVLPISWDYILYPRLYNDKLNQLTRIYEDKLNKANTIMFDQNTIPDDCLRYGSYWYYGGEGNTFYSHKIWSYDEVIARHKRYQRYIYENYFPASREVEQAMDEVYRKRISIENIKNWAFFYNPIVLFHSLSMKISGNSLNDYIKLLYDSREIRDDLVSVGIREEWLLDERFNAVFKLEYSLGSENDEMDPDYSRELYERASANLFEFDIPAFRRYAQPRLIFGDIFYSILPYLVMFVVSILALWLLTWYKFMKYDLR